MKSFWKKNPGDAKSTRTRRFAVALIGGTILVFGIVLIVLPGPAVIVIPAGLAILATEFAWAARSLEIGRDLVRKQKEKFKRKQK